MEATSDATTNDKHPGRGRRRAAGLGVGAALVGGAVVTELRKPPRKRTWHGKLLGVVPYDLRKPTAKRLKATFWNPRGPLLTPHAVGVGWTLNVGRALRLLHLR
jgi:hypothetical protein